MTCLQPETRNEHLPDKFSCENYYTVPLGELNILVVCVCVRERERERERESVYVWMCTCLPYALWSRKVHYLIQANTAGTTSEIFAYASFSILLLAFLLLWNQKETNVYLTTMATKIHISVTNWMSSSVSRENFRVRDILNFLFPPSSFFSSF
jgi:hypothetical protein